MKVFNLLKNLWQRAKSYSDSNLQSAKDYYDEKMQYIGTYTNVTGTMVTKSWSNATTTTTWTAPRDGIYLMQIYISPQTDQAMANAYKQFRTMGSAQVLVGDTTTLYWSGNSGTGGVVAFGWTFPVKALEGQTVSANMWTGTANVTFNVRIVGVMIANIVGGS